MILADFILLSVVLCVTISVVKWCIRELFWFFWFVGMLIEYVLVEYFYYKK